LERTVRDRPQRDVELMWLTGRLMPDFKTGVSFREDNGPAIRGACPKQVDKVEG
jgi:transposase